MSNLVAGRFSIRSLTVYRSAPILIGGSTTGIGGVILHGIIFGAMLGSWTPISASFDAKHLGRRHLGRGRHGRRDRVGASPPRFSLGFDLSGNYMPVLVLADAAVSDRRCTLRATSKTVRI